MIFLVISTICWSLREPADYVHILSASMANQIRSRSEADQLNVALELGNSFSRSVVESPLVVYEMALACNRQNRLDEAMELYNRALKINPDIPEALYDRAELYLLNRKFDEAQKDLLHAWKFAPNHWVIPLRLAEIAAEREQGEKLEEYLSLAARSGFKIDRLPELGSKWFTWSKNKKLRAHIRRVLFLYGNERIWDRFLQQ